MEKKESLLSVSWGGGAGGLAGRLGHSGAGALRGWGQAFSVPGTSPGFRTHQQRRGEKGHYEVVTHPTGGGPAERLKVSLRSAPVQLNYLLTRQVQALS